MMSNRIFLKGAASLGVVLAIAACSDGGGGSSGIDTSQPLADSFVAVVKAVVATSADDSDPRETDSLSATSPEDSDASSIDS
jgi:hypothetical protein